MSAPEQEKLDQLGQDIATARRHADEALGTDDHDDPKFIDRGTVGDEVVNDTIAPPG